MDDSKPLYNVGYIITVKHQHLLLYPMHPYDTQVVFPDTCKGELQA